MKKTFKKITLASLLILILSFSVFATPSPETTGFIPEVFSAADASGNAITATLNQADAAIVDDAMKTETIKNALGDAYTEDMIVFDVRDVTVPAGTAFPITITFTVKGVTSATTGCFMHWNGTAWEKIDAIFGTDTMTGTFNSLSPIAFVTNLDVTQLQVGTSPQTSDYIPSVITVLALSAAAALILSKKHSK